MNLYGFDVLWGLCKALEVSVIVLILKRRLLREWFWVVLYCVLRLTIDAVGFYARLRGDNPLFFYSFWAGESIICMVEVGILYTIYGFTFKSIKIAPPAMRIAIYTGSALSIIVVSGSSIGKNTFGKFLPYFALTASSMFAVGFAVLLVISIYLSAVLGVKWDIRTLLVDAGLSLSAAISIAWYGLHMLHPSWHADMRDMIDRMSYLVTITLWVLAFIVDIPQFSPDLKGRIHKVLDQKQQEKAGAETVRS